MRSCLSIVLLLALSSVVSAQSVKLPAEVKGEPREWILIVPDSKDGGEVKWHLGKGLTEVKVDKLFPGMKAAGVVVKAPKGRYEVWAWNAKGDVASPLSVCIVVVGDASPDPAPVPPTPEPTDPLTKAFQEAYSADQSVTKADDKARLAAVYRAMVPLVPAVVTQGDFLNVSTAARKARIEDRLKSVREVMNTEVRRIITDGPSGVEVNVVLSAEQRTALETLLAKVAAILEGIR